jgi:tRNA(Ile)-lysidine synthase
LHNKAVLFELFKPFGITNVRLDDLRKVINGKTGGQIFTDTHRIIKNRKEIIVSDEDKKNEIFYSLKSILGFRKVPEIASAGYFDIIACIDSEKISFPLFIRKWKAGDYFYPLGMRQKKKLSDYFIDKKYSRLDKENILILESDTRIVWIIGDRIDNRFRVTKSTKKTLIIKSVKKAPERRKINRTSD